MFATKVTGKDCTHFLFNACVRLPHKLNKRISIVYFPLVYTDPFVHTAVYFSPCRFRFQLHSVNTTPRNFMLSRITLHMTVMH